MDDPAHQAIVKRLEKANDKRWNDREEALLRRLSGLVQHAVAQAVAPLQARIAAQAREIDHLRDAILLLGRTADVQAELLKRQGTAMETWANNSATVVTRVEQLSERMDARDHYCAVQHGNGASLPPGG